MPQLLTILWCLLAASAHAAGIEGLLFVPSKLAAEVAVIDTDTNQVVRRLPTGSTPLHAAVSPSLGALVTTSWRGDRVNLVDVQGLLPTEHIALDLRPDGIALDPSGRILAVSSLADDAVALVDLAARRQTARIAGLVSPHHLSFAPDGRRLYVANLGTDRLTEIDVAAGRLAREIELAPAGTDLGGATNVALLAGGREALVAFGSGSELALVDLAAGEVLRRVPVGELPWHAFSTIDGRRLLVPNQGEGTVSLLDGTTLDEIARVPVGAEITDVHLGWFETVALVVSRAERKAIAIEVESGRLVGEIPLPGAPEAGVTTPDGARLYVALGDRGAVAVIDLRERRLRAVIDGVVRRPWSVQMAGALNYCR